MREDAMTRKRFLKRLLVVALSPLTPVAWLEGRNARPSEKITKLDKPKLEWRKLLPSDMYNVLFEEETEQPHSSRLNHEKRDGTYICAACHLPLFDSKTKYESGTGWPSFYQPLDGRLNTRRDFKLLWPRTEYHCVRCSGHQGHVFSDGPPPTGQRWCNNGLALQFVPTGDPMPPLRT